MTGYNKTYLEEIGGNGVDWIHLAQGRVQWRDLVNTVMNLFVVKRQRTS
jgi:hypothetical protein